MKILKVKPYNDLWFDCINNNIIGILSAHEENFKKLPIFYNGTYIIHEKSENIHPNRNDLMSHINVQFDWPDLSHIFEVKEIELSIDQNIIEVVRSLIDDNYYIFADIDRYYFPKTPNYLNESFIHPTLIYGYNNNIFKLMEDCVKIGEMGYYEIENSSFKQAFLSTLSNKSKSTIHCIRLKEEWPSWDMNIDKELVIKFLNNLLQTHKTTESTSIIFQGLGALKEYGRLFEQASTQILIQPDKFMWFYQQIRRGIVLQKRNLMIVQNLYEQNILKISSYEILVKMFNEHYDRWVFFTNKTGLIMYKHIEKKDISKFKELNNLLQDLYDKENTLLTLFLEHIHG